MKLRTKKPSHKDQLISVIQSHFEKSKSLDDFVQHLSEDNIKTYSIGGVLTGVYYGKRKFRFRRTLGINVDALLLKDRFLKRERDLKGLLGKGIEQKLER